MSQGGWCSASIQLFPFILKLNLTILFLDFSFVLLFSLIEVLRIIYPKPLWRSPSPSLFL